MVYKIKHDKDACIGCGACVSMNPDVWEMDSDGKAKLKNSENDELEISDEAFEKNKQIADICPVNAIHIFKDGEKII